MILRLQFWARDLQLALKEQLVTKYHADHRSWPDSLERPRQGKIDMRIGTRILGVCLVHVHLRQKKES